MSGSAVTSIASSLNGLPAGLPSANKVGEPSEPFGKLFTDAVGDVTALESQARTAVNG